MVAPFPSTGLRVGSAADFIRGYFAWLEHQGIASAVLHGWREGFAGPLSDIDHVLEPAAFARIAHLVAAYCDACGWVLCQVLRHEGTAAYCICANRAEPTMVVALDACSDYSVRGTRLIEAVDLLRGRVPMESGGWHVADATSLAYRFIKGAVKGKDPEAFAAEAGRSPAASRDAAAELARTWWAVDIGNWDVGAIRDAWSRIDRVMARLPRESWGKRMRRVARRITCPSGLVLWGGQPAVGALEACAGRFFRRVATIPAWKPGHFMPLASSTLIHAERIPAPWHTVLPESWKLAGIEGEGAASLASRLVPQLAARCLRRESLEAPLDMTRDTADSEIHGERRPRVLMSAFACEPNRGSEQEVGWRWALEMARWFDVTVITQARNRPGIERELAERALPPDRTLRFEYFQLPGALQRLKSRFDPLTWPYYALWQWRMLGLARRLHRAAPFDLAHHVTFVSFRVPVRLKRLGIPVVFGPVGGADRAPWRLLLDGFGPLPLLKEVLRNLSVVPSRWLITLLPPIQRGRGTCIAATPSMAAIFEQAGLPHRLLPAIGVDPAERTPQQLPTREGGLRLLYVGRFHPLKGVGLLLEAFAQANLPGSTLTLVGAGAQEGDLRRLAERLGIAQRVTWTGRIPRGELPDSYRKHDLLVAPSLYESGGLAALEAMSEGLPVIALDVGGHSLSITPDCGTPVPATGSVPDVTGRLAEAILRYAANPSLLRGHGEAAHLRVRGAYAWSCKADAMREVYASLLERTD